MGKSMQLDCFHYVCPIFDRMVPTMYFPQYFLVDPFQICSTLHSADISVSIYMYSKLVYMVVDIRLLNLVLGKKLVGIYD